MRLMWRIWVTGLALLLGAGSGALAAITPPTASAVLDETRALSPDALTMLQAELTSFEAETGVKLFIKAIPFLDPGSSLRSTARETRRDFCPTGSVALILLERGNGGIGVSHSPELWQRYPMAQMVETLRAALAASADTQSSLEERALGTARAWMKGVRQLELDRRAHQRMLPARERPLQAAFLATLVLGCSGCLLLGNRARAVRQQRSEQLYFPEVTVGQRLGAPHGGGLIASVRPSDDSA